MRLKVKVHQRGIYAGKKWLKARMARDLITKHKTQSKMSGEPDCREHRDGETKD